MSALGGDSQNFLRKLVRFLITLGLKILRLFRLKLLFETDISLKGDVNHLKIIKYKLKSYEFA